MATHPAGFDAVLREAQVRAGLVLYGNTRDVFSRGGSRYVTLPAYLLEVLSSYTIRAVWDRVDGLRFHTTQDESRWSKALDRQLGTPTGVQAYDMGAEDEAPAAEGNRIELAELIARYRMVLREKAERPLLLLDWSHLLVTQPAHPDAAEREILLQLGKALVGEAHQSVDSDQLARGSGLVVLISAHLGAVPPALYQGEPRVRLLTMPAPTREERRGFFDRHYDDLKVEALRTAPGMSPPPQRIAVIEALTELTDQLTTADLRQIVVLSRSLPTQLRADRLLNLYRFGEQRSPWEDLSEARLREVAATLSKRVIGQEKAVEHVATMIIRAWLGLAGLQHSARRTKPKGTLFFVGPTGVGKTELAKACAEFLFGDEAACIRFDMSEYNHEHSDQRLVGAPPGYVGFEEGGQLTNAVAARPFCVLLFDEVEKAHPRVLDKFLQILEDGRLTDGRGETSWFSEAVVIFTSNIGAASAPSSASADLLERHFRTAVETDFVERLKRPELLNRLGDNIVVFQPVAERSHRLAILRRKLQPLTDHVAERWGVKLCINEEALELLVQASRTEHGGRGLLNAVERALMNPLAHFLFEHHAKLRKGRLVEVVPHDGAIEFELNDE